MAADTRKYKSKEKDQNGNEVILRDQQLVEQASQTTMISTEYFEIVDADGRMAKIPKDSMISIVGEALGILLNGLADQTTITKVPTLNGDTLGASTVATLRKLMGGIKAGGNYPQSTDSLTIKENICYHVGRSNYSELHLPEQYGLFYCIMSGNTSGGYEGMHKFINGDLNKEYTRICAGGTWSAWKSVPLT